MQLLLAQHEPLIQQALCSLIARLQPEWVVRAVASLSAAFDAMERDRFDIVVLDLTMPGLEAARTIAALRTFAPHLRIIALTDDGQSSEILACLAAGANGSFRKGDESEQVMRCLRTVAEGAVYLSSTLQLDPGKQAPSVPLIRAPHLTARQKEVLQLLATGMSVKAIARELDMGVGTVKAHTAAVYQALGTHNRIDLIRRASQLGLALPRVIAA